jgi:hypothetical protein
MSGSLWPYIAVIAVHAPILIYLVRSAYKQWKVLYGK